VKTLNKSAVFAKDIYSIIADKNIPFDRLRNSNVLLTGATGLIGACLTYTFAELNNNGYAINVYALVLSKV
jgi:hypothetical protein